MLLALSSENQKSQQHDDSSENNINCGTDEVCVAIGDETQIFQISTLQQLPYFDAILSQRWKQQNKRIIKLFDEYQGIGFDDLNLLLKCIELEYIPTDTALSLRQLETLVKCGDFFCVGNYNSSDSSNNDGQSVINKKRLVRYFGACKPAITVSQRKQWQIESNNSLIRASLSEYDEILRKQIFNVRGDSLMLPSTNDDDELSRITYDHTTALTLFKNKFKFIMGFKPGHTYSDTNPQFHVSITNFDAKLFKHLYKHFSIFDYWTSFGHIDINISNINDINTTIVNSKDYESQSKSGHETRYTYEFGSGLVKLIKILAQWHHNDAYVDIDCNNNYCNSKSESMLLTFENADQEKVIKKILRDITVDACRLAACPQEKNNLPSIVSPETLCVARINFCSATECHFSDICTAMSWTAPYLAQNEAQILTKNVIAVYDDYRKNLQELESTDDEKQKEKEKEKENENETVKEMEKKSLASWYKFFQLLLDCCSDRFILSNVKLWFPIVYQATTKYQDIISCEKWTQFVFDKIISKFSTQSAFNFGLYLVDFMTHYHGGFENIKLDQRYFDFLKESVGITWDITAKVKFMEQAAGKNAQE